MLTVAGILLLMIGASLTFAVEREVEGVDLQLVGWILMAGGLAALFFAIARFAAAMNRGASRMRWVDQMRWVDRSGTGQGEDDADQSLRPRDHAEVHGRDRRHHRRTRVKRGRDDRGWTTWSGST